LWVLLFLKTPRWMPVLLSLLVIQAGLALYFYYQANPYKPNWRQITAYVQAHRQPGEPIYTAFVLLDMLADEASYHFGERILSIQNSPVVPRYWLITLEPAGIPTGCTYVPDSGAREVYVYHCLRAP
jgi:hypothetical protein